MSKTKQIGIDVIILIISTIIMLFLIQYLISDIKQNKYNAPNYIATQNENFDNKNIDAPLLKREKYTEPMVMVNATPALFEVVTNFNEYWKWCYGVVFIIIWISGAIFSKSLKRILNSFY